MTNGLAHAGSSAVAMAGGGVRGSVLVRSQRRAAAVGTRVGTPTQIRQLADHTEQTTAAFVLAKPTQPDALPVRYTAVTGCGTRAVHRAARLTAERSGVPWRGPGVEAPDEQLVEAPPLNQEPLGLIEDIVRQLACGALKVSAEAHSTTENRLFLPVDGEPVQETLHTNAIVVDLLRADVRIAEADLAWSGQALPDLGSLAADVEQSLQRASAPLRPTPPRVQMMLLDGSAGAFLHEVCGHLLESTRQRPSLLAGHESRHVAYDRLSVDDAPRRRGSFGGHHYTMLGTPTQCRPLLDAGRLAGLLQDVHDGPWRAESARHTPQPRMSHLELAPAPSPTPMDAALGNNCHPVVRVHRLGFGSLDHRDGTVILEVKDATIHEASAVHRLDPFLVTAEARQLLKDVRAVGPAQSVRTWSAYCLATSGSLPVGASTPSLLTGPLSTLPHRPLSPPRDAVPRPVADGEVRT